MGALWRGAGPGGTQRWPGRIQRLPAASNRGPALDGPRSPAGSTRLRGPGERRGTRPEQGPVPPRSP